MIGMFTIRIIDIAAIDLAEPIMTHIAATEAIQTIVAIVIIAITTAGIIIIIMVDLQGMAMGVTVEVISLFDFRGSKP